MLSELPRGDPVERLGDLRVVKSIHDLDKSHRRVALEHGELLTESLLPEVLTLDSLLVEWVAAPATAGAVGLVELLTTDALDHRDGVVSNLDVDAVGARDGPIVCVTEDSDVSRRLVGAADPAVVILEERLVDVLAGEVARRALSELCRRRRRRRVERRVPGESLQHITQVVPTHLLRGVDAAPEIVAATTRMAFEPVADVGDGLDDRRRARAVLAVLDVDPQPELPLGDVVDLELVELGGARPEVPAERDERFVTDVRGLVDHRLHVLLPVEHLARAGRRVVGAGVARRHPRERLGRLLDAEGVATERAEALPIPAIRLLVLVGAVDPADDRLGGVAVLEGVSEPTDLASHLDAPHEDVAVVARGDLAGAEQFDVSVRVEDGLSVGFAHSLALLTSLDGAFDRRPGLIGHVQIVYQSPCKHDVRSPPRPYTILLTWPVINPASGVTGQFERSYAPVESEKRTPNAAIASPPAASGTEVSA